MRTSPTTATSTENRAVASAAATKGVRATSSVTDGEASPSGLHSDVYSRVPDLNTWMQGRQPLGPAGVHGEG
jgi:hypothetical protein